MPTSAARPAALVGRVFRGTAAVRRGLLTERQLHSSAWRRLFRDVYVDAAVRLDHGVLCAAAALAMPAEAGIAGRSAAWLYGARLVGTDDPVEVLVPRSHRFGPMAGLRVRTGVPPAGDVRRRPPRVTSVVRTALDLARGHDLVEAVTLLDALRAAGALPPGHLAAVATRAFGERGGARAMRALHLSDGWAESPQESRLRVRLILAGLPRPASQHVSSSTRLVGSSRGSTSPGRTRGWRWSTTVSGTPRWRLSGGTGGG